MPGEFLYMCRYSIYGHHTAVNPGGHQRADARHPLAPVLLTTLTLLAALAMTACGGGGGGGGGGADSTTPTVSTAPSGNPVIGESAAIVITFDESMDTATLALGGNMAGESGGGAWSAGSAADDTLTVSPATAWSLGTGRTLTVDARDPAGNALSTLSLTFTVVAGTSFYVSDSAGNIANDGLSPATAKKTISAAITAAAASTPANVLVAEGAYSVTSGSTHIVMQEGISLYGGHYAGFTARDPAAHATTITDASASGGTLAAPNRAVEAGSTITAATVIDGFTLTGGGGDVSSAVFVTNGGAPTVTGNIINGGSGGNISVGIHNSSLSLSAIQSNTINGGSGGVDSYGIFNDSSSPAISGNTINAGSGGINSYGIRNGAAFASIQNNTIDGGGGGTNSYGIYNDNSSLTVRNNTILGGSGGTSSRGIFNTSSSPTLQNNAIDGGSGTNFSYGIFNDSSSPTIQNNTIDGGSGGSRSVGIYSSSSSPFIENNIVFTSAGITRFCLFEGNATGDPASVRNNDLFDCPTALYFDNDTAISMLGVDGSGNLAQNANGTGMVLATPTALGNVSADPLFVNQAGGDWHFTGSSTVNVAAGGLNGIDEVWGFTDDKDGVARPTTGIPWAMGAYEP